LKKFNIKVLLKIFLRGTYEKRRNRKTDSKIKEAKKKNGFRRREFFGNEEDPAGHKKVRGAGMKKTIRSPVHLSGDAKEIWKGIINEYSIDDVAGLRILRVALESYDRAQAARKAVDREGMTVTDKFGQIKPHPLLPIERDSRAAFLAGLKALNLNLEPLRDAPGRPPGR
jgi:phage terminase small subunit